MTNETREYLDSLNLLRPVKPYGSQTLAQAVNFRILSIGYLCQLEGVPEPDEAELRQLLSGN